MKRFFIPVLTALLLTGCSASMNDSSSTSDTSQKTTVLTTKPAQETTNDNNENDSITISAKAISYKDGILTFEYNGNQQSLPLEEESFKDINFYDKLHTSIVMSPLIINCGLLDEVKAELVMSKDMTRIISCDVVKDNGIPFDAQSDYPIDWTAEDEYKYMFTYSYKGHGIYEAKNTVRTITIDMNSLYNYAKCYLPQEMGIGFAGYLLNNDYLLVDMFSCYDKNETGFRQHTTLDNSYMSKYFGTIQKLYDEKADILLDNKKTLCTVPTDFCDGELNEGMQVTIILDEDESILNKESAELDYAVICTD